MSALSAMVSSCSGDASLFGLGGDGGVGGGPSAVLLLFFLTAFFPPRALRKIGASFSSSLAGGDDSADESESDIVVVVAMHLSFVVAEMYSSWRGSGLESVQERARALRNDVISIIAGRHSPDSCFTSAHGNDDNAARCLQQLGSGHWTSL